jgi:hypothetical protein
MANLKLKRCYDVFAPCDQALVLEEMITAVQKPNLFTQSFGNLHLHINLLCIYSLIDQRNAFF